MAIVRAKGKRVTEQPGTKGDDVPQIWMKEPGQRRDVPYDTNAD